MSALQEERSAETRRRLLDATVACLFERGYAGTTTTEIASRAGVSRGAQLHHFPKKDELVVSALEHVFELRLAEMSAAIAEPPSGSREHRLAVLIDAMWPMFKGPTFYAWLELVVASRTDPALNDAVRAASVRFGEGFRIGLAALLDWPADREDQLRRFDQHRLRTARGAGARARAVCAGRDRSAGICARSGNCQTGQRRDGSRAGFVGTNREGGR